MKKIALSVAALVALCACGGTSSQSGVVKAGEAKGGLFNMSRQDDVKVNTGEAFKNVNSVVIGSFMVAFDTKKSQSAKAGGGLMGSGFGGKSTANSDLTGVDDKTMQAITDAAYTDFVARLKAKGYTVADRSALLEHADFKGTTTFPSPYEDTSGGLLSHGTAIKYFSPTALGPIRPFGADIPGVGLSAGIGFSNPSVGGAQFAQKTGQKVIHVVYRLSYSNADSYGNSWTSSSAISVGQGLTAVPDATHIGIIGGESGSFSTNVGSVALGQPLTSEKEFAKVNDATSGAAKGIEVATNVIGIMGGVGSNSSRTYTFEADPAKYKAASLDVISQSTDALVGKMASLK